MEQASGTLTRRGFLSSAIVVAATSSWSLRALAAIPNRLAADPNRPQFHLLPAKNWMNDPNGPIYWKGRYHMFFQYNPNDSVWGDMHWAHAVSPDMIHWAHRPVALAPTPNGPDAAGCFTGSAIVDGDQVAMLYTGIVDATAGEATGQKDVHLPRESQCLAVSSDPDLQHWIKTPEAVIAEPPAGLAVTGFRDPSAWKQGEWYYMTVGSGVEKTGGAVLLYRSKDLRQWTYLHMLASGRWNGQSGSDVVATGEMWECPEFFPLEGKHILIYSTEGKVYWQSGTLDNETMTFHAERDGLLDLGSCYYAPKTQVDSSGRRILWGWIREKRTEEQLHAAGWAGMMSLPRVLSLTRDGSLRMQMLPQLRNQRGSSSEQSIQNACGEFVCTSTQSAAAVFELSIRTPQEELLRIRSSADGSSLLIEDISVPLGTSQGIRVHGYLDGSVVEIIVNDRIAHTKRFYNHDATAPEIQFHAAGATLEVWNVRPISQDRLTS